MIDLIPDDSLTQGVNRPMRVANIIEEGRLGGPQIRIVRVAKAMKSCVNTLVVMPNHNSADFMQLCNKEHINYVQTNI